MRRLIDADKLKETLVIMANKCGGSLDILDISDAIETTLTEERTRGEWKSFTDGMGRRLNRCSECEIVSIGKSFFCPNCGSDNRPKEGE